MITPRIIQIISHVGTEGDGEEVYGLDNEGALWKLYRSTKPGTPTARAGLVALWELYALPLDEQEETVQA